MAIVPVSQLKVGDRLNQSVNTSLGGMLFTKGKLITPREIEILRAFFIHSVSIEQRLDDSGKPVETDSKATDVIEAPETADSFFTAYYNMLKILKVTFSNIGSGRGLQILDVRTSLEQLIAETRFYNILTFTPRNLTPQDFIFHNSILVAMTSHILARWHGFQQKDLMQIALAGLFHDIGNTKIDEALLMKPGKLLPKEIEELRKHTVQGYTILKTVPAINEGVKLTALQHHEKMDGSGYPLGLKGETIHIYARVIAVADFYHALTNNRPHRTALSPYLVLEQLHAESFGKLDPLIVQTFIQKVTTIHNGALVRLSDNRIGEIVFSDRNNPTRPWVSVNGVIVNLAMERQLYIKEVIPK